MGTTASTINPNVTQLFLISEEFKEMWIVTHKPTIGVVVMRVFIPYEMA